MLVYKPAILFSVSSRSRRPIRSGSTPLLSKSVKIPTYRGLSLDVCVCVCVFVCVRRLCVYGRVCLVQIRYICFEYKAIISFPST